MILRNCMPYADPEVRKSFMHNYYQENKEKFKKSRQIWRENNREKDREHSRKGRLKHPNRDREYYLKNYDKFKEQRNTPEYKEYQKTRNKKYYDSHREKRIMASRNYSRNAKIKVISHYSNGTNKCNCCGESIMEFLSINHIHGGGVKHRKEIKRSSGTTFYNWLIRNNFPEGFDVLCMNCNFASGHSRDKTCPHKIK